MAHRRRRSAIGRGRVRGGTGLGGDLDSIAGVDVFEEGVGLLAHGDGGRAIGVEVAAVVVGKLLAGAVEHAGLVPNVPHDHVDHDELRVWTQVLSRAGSSRELPGSGGDRPMAADLEHFTKVPLAW
jgi:hypothetical protein